MSFTLSKDGTSFSEKFAQGQVIRVCANFLASSDIPNSTNCRFTFSFCRAGGVDPQGLPLSIINEPYFEAAYPSVANTQVQMSFIGASRFKNINAWLKRGTDAQNIGVALEFLSISDFHEFLYYYNYDPVKLYTVESIQGSQNNIYREPNFITLKLAVYDADTLSYPTAQSIIEAQSSYWNQYNGATGIGTWMELGGQARYGFIFGSDLTIKIQFKPPNYGNPGSVFYGGIFRVDNVDNGLNVWTALNMQMGKIQNTIVAAEEWGSGNIKFDKLKNQKQIVWDNDKLYSYGEFTIDDSYFAEKGKYRYFIIYQVGNAWYSYLSDVFEKVFDPYEILGDIDCSLEVEDFAAVVDGCCLKNAVPCLDVRICLEYDKASFDLELIAAGLPGTFDDYYVEDDICVPVTYGDNPLIAVTMDPLIYEKDCGNTSLKITRCIRFKIPAEWAGKTTLIWFEYKFNINGDIYRQMLWTSVHVVAEDATIQLKATDPTPIELEPCHGKYGIVNYKFDGVTPNTKRFGADLFQNGEMISPYPEIVSKESNFVSDNDADINIDFKELEPEQEYCLKLRAWTLTGVPIVACPCDDIHFSWHDLR